MYRAMDVHLRDHPPMQTAGPRSMAEGFATVLQSLTSGKDEIPYWVTAPSLLTRPAVEEERQRQARKQESMQLEDIGV